MASLPGVPMFKFIASIVLVCGDSTLPGVASKQAVLVLLMILVFYRIKVPVLVSFDSSTGLKTEETLFSSGLFPVLVGLVPGVESIAAFASFRKF